MEIICSICNTKYNIPDERIPHGKRGTATCKKCGGSIIIEPIKGDEYENGPPDPGSITTDGLENPYQITEKEFESFIGPNSERYLFQFRKFGMPGIDHFSFTWHWPAFFITFLWMLYRKLYLWALILFIIWLIPGFGLVLMIIFGLTGNYIYYRHAKAKIIDLKRQQPAADISASLTIIGGVNKWVKTLVIILAVITLIIIAMVFIPLFVAI